MKLTRYNFKPDDSREVALWENFNQPFGPLTNVWNAIHKIVNTSFFDLVGSKRYGTVAQYIWNEVGYEMSSKFIILSTVSDLVDEITRV